MKAGMLLKPQQQQQKALQYSSRQYIYQSNNLHIFLKYLKNQHKTAFQTALANRQTQGLHKIITCSLIEDPVAVEHKFANPKYTFEFFLFHHFYYQEHKNMRTSKIIRQFFFFQLPCRILCIKAIPNRFILFLMKERSNQQ